MNIVKIDNFNIEQLSHLILVLKLLNLNRKVLAGTNDITNKNSQNQIFLFNFAITKICVAIRLPEDGTRMVDTYFRLSPCII